MPLPPRPELSLALIEVANLAPSFVVADRLLKTTGVELLAIEGPDGTHQCIKLRGPVQSIQLAAELAVRIAQAMGSDGLVSWIAGPRPETHAVVNLPAVFNPLLSDYDARVARDVEMSSTPDAIGLLETQGLVAALHATDTMLKSASVELVGKEKIGAAYVTIMIRGDVAAVQAAIQAGRGTVEKLGGKLIMADVITRPHPDLAKLLPAM
jgi:microcompartment protein CcmL/EutN